MTNTYYKRSQRLYFTRDVPHTRTCTVAKGIQPNRFAISAPHTRALAVEISAGNMDAMASLTHARIFGRKGR